MELGDANESQLDESLDGANTAADEEEIDESILDQEIEVEESSDSQSDTQSETSLSSSSTTEMKEENSNCALNTDSEENPTQNGNVAPKRAQRMRSSRRPQSQRHGSEEGNVEKDEDMDVDHKAMLSSADRKIQVGDDFQAHVDETQKIEQESQMTGEEREQASYAVVLWCPPGNINENKLIEFCEDAVGVYKISYDRALYILQKSNFDFNVAREKLKRRRLVAEEWSDDDRTLFKQAFHMFGKRFDKIRQTMPYRSMASLIQFYYNTKKDIDYKSLFDSRMANDSDDDKSLKCGLLAEK
uniref:Mesoderm induction early response protein 1 n=1 Tax=Angiostrongylus cantonensis TaxID=6313 RepID=A0A0K0DNF7_ANGCA